MIYMVEAALNSGHTDAQWEAFYGDMKPLPLLLSVDGLNSAQRFKGCAVPPSYLAVYAVESAAVLTSASYRNVGGGNFRTERWKPMLSMWTRNLYAGAADIAEVPPEHALLLQDADAPRWPWDIPVLWLESAGLDRTAPYRGLAQVPAAQVGDRIARHPSIRAYRPLTVRATKAGIAPA